MKASKVYFGYLDFYVWGRDSMVPFSSFHKFLYILVTVYYVSKWIGAFPTHANDRIIIDFYSNTRFPLFGIPKIITSDNGSHFCNKFFRALVTKYRVVYSWSTLYHLDSNN